MRKQNYSITDIKANLHADSINLSLDTIDKILKDEGFSPLPIERQLSLPVGDN
jgi:hypothetical protein